MVKLPINVKNFGEFFLSPEFLAKESPGAYSYFYEESRNLVNLGNKADKMVSKHTPFPRFAKVMELVAEVGYNIGKTDQRVFDVLANHLYGEDDVRDVLAFFSEVWGRDFTEYFAWALEEKLAKRMTKEIGEDRIKAILG